MPEGGNGDQSIADLDTTSSNLSQLQTGRRAPRLHRTLFSSFSSQSLTNLTSAQLITNYANITKHAQPGSEQLTGTTPGSVGGAGIVDSSESNNSNGPNSPSGITTDNGALDNHLTLLDWIKSTDPQNKLSTVIEETRDILESFDAKFKWSELEAKISKLLGQIESNQQMKEIEGLAKRLDDLKGFLGQASKFLVSQSEINEVFILKFIKKLIIVHKLLFF
jgi:hypothetical protein